MKVKVCNYFSDETVTYDNVKDVEYDFGEIRVILIDGECHRFSNEIYHVFKLED